ncbi:MAG: (Fe-S)-binding protein [Nitrospira sp.]|nr:(Fe-S)-binding protein [Nitrospira sp.]
MALADFSSVMKRCVRCSYCKWISLSHVKSWRFAKGCPSVEAGKFHSYSAGGRLAIALSLLEGRIDYTDRLMEIVYKCQLCGSCDAACKVCSYNMEPLEVMHELRTNLVENGQILPEHMFLIEHLRKEDNMMLKPKSERGKWASGFDVKDLTSEKAEVVFHAGCNLSFDEELWRIPRAALTILIKAGVDVGIMGKDESCCGGKAYSLGFRGEFRKFAESNTDAWVNAGVKTVVTCCADGYFAFKNLYPKYGIGKTFEVLHITEYLDRLIKAGRIKFTNTIPLTITYHDPCHLGRLGELQTPWNGVEKKIRGQIVVHEPRKPVYRGAKGVYEPARDVLRSIPGIKLIEMERIKEYSWCCGAGGGVKEAYPEFAESTARERIEEAKTTGAEAIVTSCPWCERNFIDSMAGEDGTMKVYDVVELVQQAL